MISFERFFFQFETSSRAFFISFFHSIRNTKIQVSSTRNNRDKNYARLTYAQRCLTLFDPEHGIDESRDPHKK